MVIDFNLNHNPDSNMFGTDAIISEPILLFIQEIEIAIKLAPYDLWCKFNTPNIQRYVFNRFISTNKIKNGISAYIANECSQATNFVYEVEAYFLFNENKKSDILYIQVRIFDTNYSQLLSTQNFMAGE